MIYLFSDEGLKLLESLCRKKTLFAFDFDGTLAAIVADPGRAQLNKTTISLLKQLGELAPLGIISGRSLPDLKSRLPSFNGYLIGNHGLESSEQHQRQKDFYEICNKWKQQLQSYLNELNGVEIEDKNYSLTIHYRKSPQARLAKSIILYCVNKLCPLPHIIAGKYVINLIPDKAPLKGEALLKLLGESGAKAAFYIGDDDTDEAIFTLCNTKIFTVRVGIKQKSQAKFYLHRQTQINLLLKTIISFVELKGCS